MFAELRDAMDKVVEIIKELIAHLTFLIEGFTSKKPIEDEDFTWEA
ncbi:MAG: hypothetical protein IKJ63_10675 [Clostridia bacterium]|nr:hypothetical protein [Clostridia bacterium]